MPIRKNIKKIIEPIKIDNEPIISDKNDALITQLEYVIDFSKRNLYFTSDIMLETQADIISRTNYLYYSDNSRSTEPINYYISSYGGDVYAMFGIVDFMNNFSVKINTICQGVAMSAAAIMLACGTGKRYATENSTIMFHQIKGESFGRASDIFKNTHHLKLLQNKVYTMLSKKTKKGVKFWEDNTKEDFYLSPEEAKKYGIIDEIIKQ